MVETRIIKEVSYLEFRDILEKFSDRIKVNNHAYFRLHQMQRKVYKDDTLIEMLTKEKPVAIGIQNNKNYALFFRRKQGYLRLVLRITTEYIEIITFYITENMPKI